MMKIYKELSYPRTGPLPSWSMAQKYIHIDKIEMIFKNNENDMCFHCIGGCTRFLTPYTR